MLDLFCPRLPQERLIVALDFSSAAEALHLAERLADKIQVFKVGMELFYRAGMPVVEELQAMGAEVFLDLKLHDIPNTVAGGVASLVAQGVRFFNVHAGGGEAMMRAAAEGIVGISGDRLLILGVTVLTSLNDVMVRETFHTDLSASDLVVQWAKTTERAGLGGIVCSGKELQRLSDLLSPAFVKVVPGIRPAWSVIDDQQRIVTPAEALKAGATYLVVGRPITAAVDPVEAVERVLEEMASV